MTPSETIAAYRSLYAPSAEELRATLPDLAEGLSAQLVELYKRPCAAAAERLAANFSGAHRTVMLFRERLVAEGEGHGG